MTDKPQNILTWESMLDVTQKAAELEAETQHTHIVMCGALAWMGVRRLCEDRLRGPVCADVLVIDTVDWMLSMHVDRQNIQIVLAEGTRQEIPLVLLPTPNDHIARQLATGDFNG